MERKFNNLVDYGDIYYDLAKIYHALDISQMLEIDKSYKLLENRNKIDFKYKNIKNLMNFKKSLYKNN